MAARTSTPPPPPRVPSNEQQPDNPDDAAQTTKGLEAQVIALQAELKAKDSKLQRLTNDLSAKELAVAKARAFIEQQKQKHETVISGMQTDIDSLDERLKAANARARSNKDDLESQVKHCSTVETELTTLTFSFKELESKFKERESRINHLQSENLELKKNMIYLPDHNSSRRQKKHLPREDNVDEDRPISEAERVEEDHETHQQRGDRTLNKTVLYMDSNKKFLNHDQLWKGVEVVDSFTVQEARKKLLAPSSHLDRYDMLALHFGVNDLDHKPGATVAKDLVKLVGEIRQRHQSLKIVVSEVTPRQLRRDEEVMECNDILNQELGDMKDVTIAHHSNLRVEGWLFHSPNDDKHLAKNSIGKFAANLKVALRKATGLAEKRQPDNERQPSYRHSRRSPLKNDINNSEKSALKKLKEGLIQVINSL